MGDTGNDRSSADHQWWRAAPYNIGIATGPSGLLVIDCDTAARNRSFSVAPPRRRCGSHRAPSAKNLLGSDPKRRPPSVLRCPGSSLLATRPASSAGTLIHGASVATSSDLAPFPEPGTTRSSLGHLWQSCPFGLRVHSHSRVSPRHNQHVIGIQNVTSRQSWTEKQSESGQPRLGREIVLSTLQRFS